MLGIIGADGVADRIGHIFAARRHRASSLGADDRLLGMAMVIRLHLVRAIIEAEHVDDPADAIVPPLVHRERGRPRRIEPPHMRLEVFIDARTTRGRLVRFLVAERPEDHTGVIAVAADDPLEFRDSLRT